MTPIGAVPPSARGKTPVDGPPLRPTASAEILDALPILAWQIDPRGGARSFNRRALEFLGWSRDEAATRSWRAAVHADDLALLDGWPTALPAADDAAECELRLRRHDGTHRWMLLRAARSNPDGDAVWQVAAIDIDARKRAEAELHASDRRSREIVDRMPGAICVMSGAGEMLFVNRRVTDYFGFTLEEMRDWERFVHPDDRVDTVAAWTHAVRTGRDYEHVHRFVRADGTYRWFLARGLAERDEAGAVVRWYVQLIDIEERKRTEHDLQAREHELRLLVDNFPGMVAFADADGRPLSANARLLDYFRKEPEDLVAYRWLEDVHPDDRPMVEDAWRRSMEEGRGLDLHYRLCRFDAVARWFHCRVEPVFDRHGVVGGWCVLLVDVDEQRRAEEALRASQAELAHATRVATMGELSASIAHEVNQPLAAVMNNAEACRMSLQAAVPDLEEIGSALTDIVRDAERATAIVARVRQLAKKTPLDPSVLDVRDVVADVLALARHETQSRRVTIETHAPDEALLVSGDRVQLQQVLLNLVVNGLDAVSHVDEPRRRLTVDVGRTAGDVVVAVRDEGVGAEPAAIARLFEPFYTTKPRGMGMGLAVSRSIVGAHGGQLCAAVNDGPGMTFTLRLPAPAA